MKIRNPPRVFYGTFTRNKQFYLNLLTFIFNLQITDMADSHVIKIKDVLSNYYK